MAVKVTSKTSAKPAEKKTNSNLGQQIRDRAYYIWEAKGRPTGREMEIWLEAEKDILRKNK